MFVEVDAVGGVACGCSECKHEVRDSAGAWVKDAQAARVKVHLADKEGMVWEDSNADEVRDELGDDVVGGGG